MEPVGAAAMVSKAVILRDGSTIELQYPRSLPEEVIRQTLIPAVEGTARSLALTLSAVRRAVVTACLDDQIQIRYLTAKAKEYYEVIPILAAAEVYNDARRHVGAMGLDADIEDAAQAALDEKRRRRLGY